MTNWLVRHRVAFEFAVAAAILGAIAVVAVSARHLVEQYEAIRRSSEIVAELDSIRSGVTDAETGQRGFLLTGDDRYLAPSLTASADIVESHVNTLRSLAPDRPDIERQLAGLETPLRDKLEELRESIRLRREKGADAAFRLVLTDRGLHASERIRSVLGAMREEEQRRLAEATGRAQQARHVLIILAALATAALLVLVFLIVESGQRARELRLTRATLREQVAEHEQTTSLLTSLVQSSDDSIVGLDLEGRILTWNHGAERLYGHPAAEVRGRPVDLLLASERRAEMAAALDRVRRQQTTERFETEHVTKDGRRVHVFLTVSPIRDAPDKVIGISIVGRDIGAQKAAEEALRRSEATSRAFLESASESIVITNAAGAIVRVNDKAEKMFGYERAELLGQPVEILIPRRARAAHVVHRAGYLAAPRVRSMGRGLDLAGVKKDGTEFPVEVSLSFVETDDGIRAIAFVTDISERLAFQRAARQADKLAALGTLSAGIAHEINNPIGIITSRVEVMLLEAEGEELPAEMRKDLEVILRHARRVASITQGLLSFARRSSGVRAPVDLNRVVEEILQLVRKDMDRAHVQVTLRRDEALPEIMADANAIGQVLLNLLTNARRAMPDAGGEITIETGHDPEARSVRLVVRDTGTGIAPEILSKIFDPFFTTKPDGTGLGLSVSHGIIHDHEGSVDVESQVGKGTTFTVTLPVDGSHGILGAGSSVPLR
ncbi:MAG TPA: PAS domain S-box protein [Verrucomicrobiae bacterium]|nr:PAS domain S-box protein [Verrucomicrobiae bacterium]